MTVTVTYDSVIITTHMLEYKLNDTAASDSWSKNSISAYGNVSVLVSRSTHITSCGGSYKSKYRESTPTAQIKNS